MQCEEAFLNIKLMNVPILASPQLDVSFRLDTDASTRGLGAVLSQVQDGKVCVIAYVACALLKAKINYSKTQKENFSPWLGNRTL